MPRSKKESAERIESALATAEPLEVKLIKEPIKNPYEGKFPYEDDPVPKRRYLFRYNQQPGTPLEFTKGRTVLGVNGKPKTVYDKYKLDDGQECELPIETAKFLNGLVFYDAGHPRPRCTCVEV